MTNNKVKYCLRGPSERGQVEDLLHGLDEIASHRRLQALLAEWLRMENVVVLTGSGCSKSCGGKVLAELEKSVLEAVNCIFEINTKKHNLSENAKAIIADRLEICGAERQKWTLGFESWLSYLVNAVYLETTAQSPVESIAWKGGRVVHIDEVARLVEFISKAIYAECALVVPDDTVSRRNDYNVAPHVAFLSKIVARDSNLGRTHLFTLNYDTLIEQTLELLGIQYFDGFAGRANARFDPSVYGLDIYYPGEVAEGRVRRFDKFLHFYKLHGSIHWRVVNGELTAKHEELSSFADYRTKAADQKAAALVTEGFAHNYREFGILPTSNKFVQTLDMPYAQLFRMFTARVNAPQTFLLVVGYGFGDDHVTAIIESALVNPSLVMLVVDPRPESPAVKRVCEYRELGKRAFILTPTEEMFKENPFRYGTFDDFAQTIIPDVKWLDDFLRLRRFEKQIERSREDGGP